MMPDSRMNHVVSGIKGSPNFRWRKLGRVASIASSAASLASCRASSIADLISRLAVSTASRTAPLSAPEGSLMDFR